jgi:hypothetical protein
MNQTRTGHGLDETVVVVCAEGAVECQDEELWKSGLACGWWDLGHGETYLAIVLGGPAEGLGDVSPNFERPVRDVPCCRHHRRCHRLEQRLSWVASCRWLLVVEWDVGLIKLRSTCGKM